jgi:hypothetical protein
MPRLSNSALANIPNGSIPQTTQLVDNSQLIENRVILKEAWNTKIKSQLGGKYSCATTPFRALNNAGDLLGRKNYSCGGSCQSFQSRPGLHGLSQRFGSIFSKCDNTKVPAAACNPKFVYDGSDYTRFKKQLYISRNYNDKSYGGDSSNSTQVALRSSKRF